MFVSVLTIPEKLLGQDEGVEQIRKGYLWKGDWALRLIYALIFYILLVMEWCRWPYLCIEAWIRGWCGPQFVIGDYAVKY